MKNEAFEIDNGDGWRLDLRRFWDPENRDESRRPVVTVPGYCMNCFILNYHPHETPLIEVLVESGAEVWAANLRGQGDSTRDRGSTRHGFADLSLVDLPAVFDFVLDKTATGAENIDVIGCSLGASLSYVYLAHNTDEHRIGAMVNIGGPLRWINIHPMLRAGVQCPSLLGAVPIRGTRQMARLAMPVLKKFPKIVSHYINADIVDLSEADELVRTIDDPNPRMSREMAAWIKDKDLKVAGLDIADALGNVDVPVQCVVAMQDGVVTPESALSVLDHIGSEEIEIVEVGTRQEPHAHADLFVANGAERRVFRPVARWLEEVG